MIYLLIAIASMSAYMLALKFFAVKGINTSQAIIVNYALASLIGVISYPGNIDLASAFSNGWWYLAPISGILFFSSMHLMALSTKIAGVSVTTISSRTALIVPIVYSFLVLGEVISLWQAVGICMVVAALIIIFYGRSERKDKGLGVVLMPLAVFLTMGAIAVCMKTAQHVIQASGNYASDYPLYEAMNFIAALACALIYYMVAEGKKAFSFTWKSVAGGLCIGTFNFLVTHSILMALKILPTGVFYASYNICVVVITALVGWLAFGEKLSRRKVAGILLAIAAIAVLMLLG